MQMSHRQLTLPSHSLQPKATRICLLFFHQYVTRGLMSQTIISPAIVLALIFHFLHLPSHMRSVGHRRRILLRQTMNTSPLRLMTTLHGHYPQHFHYPLLQCPMEAIQGTLKARDQDLIHSGRPVNMFHTKVSSGEVFHAAEAGIKSGKPTEEQVPSSSRLAQIQPIR